MKTTTKPNPMQIDSTRTRFIAFDIETAGHAPEILAPLLPAFDPTEVKHGNTKDPALIAAKVEQARARHETEFYSKAALSPLTGSVAAIGYSTWFEGLDNEAQDESCIALSTPCTREDETTILADFWNRFSASETGQRTIWVGHNILDFDLPFLVTRSRILGVKVPSYVIQRSGSKFFFTNRFIDTRQLFALGRNVRDLETSLGHICRLLGLGDKSGNGADFAGLVNTDLAAARAYLEQDIALTRKLAVRLGIEEVAFF